MRQIREEVLIKKKKWRSDEERRKDGCISKGREGGGVCWGGGGLELRLG